MLYLNFGLFLQDVRFLYCELLANNNNKQLLHTYHVPEQRETLARINSYRNNFRIFWMRKRRLRKVKDHALQLEAEPRCEHQESDSTAYAPNLYSQESLIFKNLIL